MDLTPAERSILQHMARRRPLIDAETAADECGLALTTARVALNRFCALGLATRRRRRMGDRQLAPEIYEITPDGNQVGWELVE